MNIIHPNSTNKMLQILTIFFFIFIPIIISISLLIKFGFKIEIFVGVMAICSIFGLFSYLVLRNTNQISITDDGLLKFGNNTLNIYKIKEVNVVLESSENISLNTEKKVLEVQRLTWKSRDSLGTKYSLAYSVYVTMNDGKEFNIGYMLEKEIDNLDKVLFEKTGKHLVK